MAIVIGVDSIDRCSIPPAIFGPILDSRVSILDTQQRSVRLKKARFYLLFTQKSSCGALEISKHNQQILVGIAMQRLHPVSKAASIPGRDTRYRIDRSKRARYPILGRFCGIDSNHYVKTVTDRVTAHGPTDVQQTVTLTASAAVGQVQCINTNLHDAIPRALTPKQARWN